MDSCGAVLKLIDAIYAAALDPARWTDFLATLTTALHGDKAGIHFEEPGSPATTVGANLHYDPYYTKQFEQYYNTRNVWIRNGEPPQPGTVLLGEDRCSQQELIKSEYYNDWLRPQNLFHLAGCCVMGGQHGGRAYLAVLRSQQGGCFTPAEKQLTQLLIPHLERAFQVHSRMAELELHKQASHVAFDRLPVGLFFLSATGKVLYFNRAAQSILDQNDGLALAHSQLRSLDAAANSQIVKAISDARNTFGEDAFLLAPGEPVIISRPSGRRSFSLAAVPLPRDGSKIHQLVAGESPAIIVLVSDPESESQTGADKMIRGFGFTKAEGKVAYLLAQGKGPEGCAEELGVGVNTVRSQLKSIMHKTGTNRQAELVHFLLKNLSLISV